MAEAARAPEFPDEYIYGSAAPVRETFPETTATPVEIPLREERPLQRERAGVAVKTQSAPAVSLFAIFGTLLAGTLMIFVVLAQISYNEIAAESVRLNEQLAMLKEAETRLEITFESVIDMKEVERYARDVLGMSRPEADQVAVIHTVPDDRAEIVRNEEEDPLREFGSFISSLLGYFRR